MVIVSCTPRGRQGEEEAWAFFTSKVLALKHGYLSILLHCLNALMSLVARKSLRAIVVYRLPGGVSVGVFLEEFSVLLQEAVIRPEELLICGDFNFHMDNKADWNATRFGELLDLFNLKQHVCVPTHERGHILDLVITRNETEGVNASVRIEFKSRNI